VHRSHQQQLPSLRFSSFRLDCSPPLPPKPFKALPNSTEMAVPRLSAPALLTLFQGGTNCIWCSSDSLQTSTNGYCTAIQPTTTQCSAIVQGAPSLCSIGDFVDTYKRVLTIAIAVGVSIYVLNLLIITFAAHKSVRCCCLWLPPPLSSSIVNLLLPLLRAIEMPMQPLAPA
jgi:hypothetical protein